LFVWALFFFGCMGYGIFGRFGVDQGIGMASPSFVEVGNSSALLGSMFTSLQHFLLYHNDLYPAVPSLPCMNAYQRALKVRTQ
jgi:hypothetical protein